MFVWVGLVWVSLVWFGLVCLFVCARVGCKFVIVVPVSALSDSLFPAASGSAPSMEGSSVQWMCAFLRKQKAL